MDFLLPIALAIPFILIPTVALAGEKNARQAGWRAIAAPAIVVSLLFILWLRNLEHGPSLISIPWIPALGINLDFIIDGLSLFYGLVVSGMGLLIVYYGIQYMDDHYKFRSRFFAYLLLFMGAMLGTVFSENLILLFIFWEMTGIASFLLIGFLHEKEESRAGARMALLVTGTTGLILMAGIVLLAQATGSFSLTEILAGDTLAEADQGLLTLAFILIAVGAFGKSAQIPFHFWLPNAMAAPTPVSAYLHSATMVKLGVFAIARFYPVFVDLPIWGPLLIVVGFSTFLLGAVLALMSNKLKGILAFSTVSALGSFIGYYGLGVVGGITFDLLHVANHVFYKGCLFMVVGIIDHCTGIKDIRQLGGLRRRMPLLAGITVVTAAAMAGVPLTFGFISKEYYLKGLTTFAENGGLLASVPLLIFFLGSIVKFAFSARLILHIFWGEESKEATAHFHAPSFRFQAAPLLLASLTLFFGLFPMFFTPILASFETAGLHAGLKDGYTLSLWHGFTGELLVSIIIMGLGVYVFYRAEKAKWRFTNIPKALRWDEYFEAGVNGMPAFSKKVTRFLRTESPIDYIPVMLGFFILLVGGYMLFAGDWGNWLTVNESDEFSLIQLFAVLLTLFAAGVVAVVRRWSTQAIALSVVGFLVTFYFVLFRAPDLAMTQILIEAATLILIILMLARLPHTLKDQLNQKIRSVIRHRISIVVAIGTGTVLGLLTYIISSRKHEDFAGLYYLKNTVDEAKGTNTVNTILVDFRGFDTLMEVAVLLIAVLGCIGLLARKIRKTKTNQ